MITMTDSIQLDPGLVAAKVSLDTIPVIDIGPLRHGPEAARLETARAIGKACRDIGFFYVINHGVSEALIARLESHLETARRGAPEATLTLSDVVRELLGAALDRVEAKRPTRRRG